MTQAQKLLEKFLQNPGSVRYAELEKILESYGFIMNEAKGSHKKWKIHSL